MSEISLTEEDLSIMCGLSAKAAFIAAVAECFLELGKVRDGEALQNLLLTTLQKNLKRAEGDGRVPMSKDERIALRQYYRLFVGFYRQPSRLENFPIGDEPLH